MAPVTLWFVAAGLLMLGLVPCGIIVCRATTMNRLVALELAGTLTALVLMLLAEGLQQPVLLDLSLGLALLALPGGLVFANFLGREL